MAAGQSAALRSVRDDEKAPSKSKTVAEAAKKGTPRELLVAMRDRIAETLTRDCQPRDKAALTKRLQDIVRDIEAIDARDPDDMRDRLRELESALRGIAPDHPLLAGVRDDDSFDPSAL